MIIQLGALRIWIFLTTRLKFILLALLGITVLADRVMKEIRKSRIIHFANFETLKRVEGKRRFYVPPFLVLFKYIILALLLLVATDSIVISIAKPLANTDFVIAIDASPSMMQTDYKPSRLEAAKRFLAKWVDLVPEKARVGLVAFSGKVRVILEPTSNIAEVKRKILSLGMIPEAGTAIGDALIVSSQLFPSSSNTTKILVLITDGRNNVGTNVTEALKVVREKGIRVYAIGVGKAGEVKAEEVKKRIGELEVYEVKKEEEGVDFETLKKIASETGGKAFMIGDEKALEIAISEIFVRNQYIPLDTDYYVLLFIIFLSIVELLLYAKYGVI